MRTKNLKETKKKINKLLLSVLFLKTSISQKIEKIESPPNQALRLTHKISFFNSTIKAKNTGYKGFSNEPSIVLITKTFYYKFVFFDSDPNNINLYNSYPSNYLYGNFKNFNFLELNFTDNISRIYGFYVENGKFRRKILGAYWQYEEEDEDTFTQNDCDFDFRDPWIEGFHNGGYLVFFVCPRKKGSSNGYVDIYRFYSMEVERR